jgi:uncharacterized protein (DUF58 family)
VELPDVGPIIFEDAETGEQLYIDTHDKDFRKRFVETAARHDYELNVLFHRLGIDTLGLSTGGDLVREIVRFARLRKQRKVTPAAFAKSNVRDLTPRLGG